MWARLTGKHQNLSWTAGYKQGRDRQPFQVPWWANRELFGLAYVEGMWGEPSLTEEIVAAQRERWIKEFRSRDLK
jgi:hypothetical protein